MPVEIRELVIRAVAVEEGPNGQGEVPSLGENDTSDRDQIVQECVREVLRILRRNRER